MRVSRPNVSLLLSLLLILFSITVTARADDDEPDEYDVKARVVRISLIDGEVNLQRNGNKDWERARLNFPLVEGDTVATAKDSRLEIQIDARNFVRLAAESVLRIVTLRDEGIAVSVVEGTAVVRLAKFESDREFFEIAPGESLDVHLSVPAAQCSLVTADNRRVVEAGEFMLRVGPSSRRENQLSAGYRIRT